MSTFVFVINPGTTSTKIAVLDHEKEWFADSIQHPDSQLSTCNEILDQIPFRLTAIEESLARAGWKEGAFSAIVGRGGLLKPLSGGTYLVNEKMKEDLTQAVQGTHASNLGALLADIVASRQNPAIPAFIVDPVSVDEWTEVARLSGLAGLDRVCLSHALNARGMARKAAAQLMQTYQQSRLIVAHLGSGTSVSAHLDGRMVDVNNSMEEGPFSMDRAGGLPVMRLLKALKNNPNAWKERDIFGNGGVFSYLKTRNFREVVRRVKEKDKEASLILDAMAYQTSKEIGQMATVLCGRCDAIVITGGMAHESLLVDQIRKRVSFIAPMMVFPGEDELRALADGAFRALDHLEPVLQYK